MLWKGQAAVPGSSLPSFDKLQLQPKRKIFLSRFWMSRSVESFLRGKTSFTDQTFLLRKGLLEVILTNVISTGTKSKEVLQSNFDLLAELMKFNHVAFKRFNKFIETEEKVRQTLLPSFAYLPTVQN